MQLEIGDYLIRGWQLSDVESLVRHANNRLVWLNLRDSFPHPYTRADAEAWIRLNLDAAPETNFAIADSESAIGGIGLILRDDVFRRSAEIGYWLGQSYWGRGITTSAVRAMTEYAFANFDICRLYAGVFETNEASMRVLAKAGYEFEGRLRSNVTKDGRTLDRFMYAMVREQ